MIIGQEPSNVFAFGMEQRLQCGNCGRVSYRTDKMDVVSIALPAREKAVDGEGKKSWEDVGLKSCLDTLMLPEALEYGCPSCDLKVLAMK
jgi:ubiquitin carboxyl-terminal hydrolase 5/13